MLPIPKRGDFLSLSLPLLGAPSAIKEGATFIAKAVAKLNRQQLKELERRDLEMEKSPVKGNGLYLRPCKEVKKSEVKHLTEL